MSLIKELDKVLSKLSERKKEKYNFSLSIYKGLTVQEFLDKLNLSDISDAVIKINKRTYDEDTDGYLLIKKISFKQTIEQKEFKEKIVVHLQNPEDIVAYHGKKDIVKHQGYIIKLTINIQTEV